MGRRWLASANRMKAYNGTTTTTYYSVTAVNVNGTLSYLAGDMLHSVSVALDGSGHVTASQLYGQGPNRYTYHQNFSTLRFALDKTQVSCVY